MAAVKLSPTLKSLLALPAARPSAIPSPPLPVISNLFDSIRSKAPSNLGRDAWLTVGTAAIMTVNATEALGHLWDYAGKKSTDAAIIREAGLKCISFNGIPRTINGLGAFHGHLPEDVLAALDTKSYRHVDESNITEINNRGRALWDNIYQPHHEKLINKLGASHPDLPVYILAAHYGPLLSDPSSLPAPQIGRILTSVVAIACLRAQRGVGPQVTSHVFGLKKAGLEASFVKEVEGGEWLTSDEGAQWVVESTDKVSEIIAGGKTTFAGAPEVQAKL
ncbi:hypothetical protein CI109_100004 [Kwoniella shandongensis]|uniref:Uncharacterized protein n=1 Tax=Kwoniella shandongensis TaxID=1734106 RepID=A0A5M6BVX7_9TREE|nr:uncharacterized protein CI109_006023 [Kwoniella shandongensis]KAA5525715.1 hypothetical protein CI109_006023 [Kwoniella shandongensis]